MCGLTVILTLFDTRINFSLDAMRVTAPAHNCFLRLLRQYPSLSLEEIDISTIPHYFPYRRHDRLVSWARSDCPGNTLLLNLGVRTLLLMMATFSNRRSGS